MKEILSLPADLWAVMADEWRNTLIVLEESLCGEYVDDCIAGALQMGESNACMKRIVAAPTAGACGVLPAVLVPYFQKRCKDTDKILKAMYVAAGIGQIIATRSSISGAAGGCQAEIGSASSMAAGALTYLQAATANRSPQRLPWR